MNASSNPVNGLATYLESITQIYEAAAAARFLRSVERFDLGEIADCLEQVRCSPQSLAERFDRLPEAAEFDVLLLAEDLNALPPGALRKLCKSLALDSRGVKPTLIGRLRDAIREKANTVTSLPGSATDSLLAAAASDEARSAAARALSIGIRGFGPLMGRTALRQAIRLTLSLHHAARHGGIEKYLADNKADLPKRLADSRAGAAPAASSEKQTAPLADNLFRIEQQAEEAERQYLALLQSVRTASLTKLERDFAGLESLPAAAIVALGKRRGYSEPNPRRLLDRLWNNIELAAATAQRSALRK